MEEFKETIVTIEWMHLITTVMEKKVDDWRLAQMCSAFVDGKYELTYSFAKHYELVNYRIIVDKEQSVPSITTVYPAAFLYENEMKELFGVKMEYIELDYHNRLYRIDEETPFLKKEEQ